MESYCFFFCPGYLLWPQSTAPPAATTGRSIDQSAISSTPALEPKNGAESLLHVFTRRLEYSVILLKTRLRWSRHSELADPYLAVPPDNFNFLPHSISTACFCSYFFGSVQNWKDSGEAAVQLAVCFAILSSLEINCNRTGNTTEARSENSLLSSH
jgi:hypothetical protein